MTSSNDHLVDLQQIKVVDTHTGGEPTRVVLSGAPDLGSGSLMERRERLRTEFDEFRSAVVNEPRGSDVIVGALLCEPGDRSCSTGVIFFNNVGVIGMCGHGTIGTAVALAHLGRIDAGKYKLETPVGAVRVVLHEDRRHVTLDNVASYRHAREISIDVPGYGKVTGDVAWGGNWFFLVEKHPQELKPERLDDLLDYTRSIRRALERQGVTGRDRGEIDHIALFAASDRPDVDSRNFVLCPGGAWDRSPCGTGTSAKVACLAAEGRLRPGELWRQESLIGSRFDATYRLGDDGTITPILTGSAWVVAEATLLLDHQDPFCSGIRW